MVRQEVVDLAEQFIVIARRDHLHMQRHQRFFTHLPDVHMVHIADFRNRSAQMAL